MIVSWLEPFLICTTIISTLQVRKRGGIHQKISPKALSILHLMVDPRQMTLLREPREHLQHKVEGVQLNK